MIDCGFQDGTDQSRPRANAFADYSHNCAELSAVTAQPDRVVNGRKIAALPTESVKQPESQSRDTLGRKLPWCGLALAVLASVLETGPSRFVNVHGTLNRRGALHVKVDRAVADGLRAGATTFRVLLKLRPGTEGRIAESLARRGHPPRLAFASTHMLAVDLDAATLEYLSREPSVDRISSDAIVRSSGITWTSSTSASPENRLVRSLGMENWAPDGRGVVVAVIDSGVVANSNLQSAAKYDFTRGIAKKASGATFVLIPTVTALTSQA